MSVRSQRFAQAEANPPGPDGGTSDAELLARFPFVRLDHDNRHFYAGVLSQRYLVNRCDDCGHWHTPPRGICDGCWSDAITPTQITGTGRLHLCTLLHQGPVVDGVSYASPFALGTVELDEQPGLRVSGPLVNVTASTRLDTPMRLTWIEIRDSPFPAFRPDLEDVSRA